MFVLVLLVVCVIISFCIYTMRRPAKYPPGPSPLPILGNFHHLPDENHLFLKQKEFAEKYGQIVGLSIGTSLLVLVDGADNVLEALRKEEFQGRPALLSFRVRTYEKNLGLLFSSGEQWVSSRKFVMRVLKGFGKNAHEDLIVDEAYELLSTIKEGEQSAIGLFSISSVNVIWRMIASKRIEISDAKSKQFLSNITKYFRRGNLAGNDVVNLYSIFKYFSPKFQFALKIIKETHELFEEVIQEHKDVLDTNNPLDLMDHYLIEVERGTPLFSIQDLISVCFDLFGAGAESTSNSLEYIFLYMALHPEIQTKMQDEIDTVLNKSRAPRLDDRSQLNYTMAVITEVERINSVAPGTVHACTRDTTFAGYFIPKGTSLFMNLRSLGYDPKYWKDPEEFRPERFLNEGGKFSKPSMLATFGLGQRQCLGEMFARNSIFIFTTSFFERFSVRFPPGTSPPSTFPQPGFTTAPQPFTIIIDSRY